MCNNLLQINNALDFLDFFKIDISNLKIRNLKNLKYRKINTDFLFQELKKYLIDYKIDCKNTIIYNKNLKNINKSKDYVLKNNFYTRNHIHNYIYDFLNVYDKQIIIKNKYSKYLDSNCISLHIRRGDYLKEEKFKKYVLSDYEIFKILNDYSDNQILIFTDDYQYVEKICRNFKNIIYAYNLNLNLDIEFLLGTITNNVIGTKCSSFSFLMKEFNKFFNSKYIK